MSEDKLLGRVHSLETFGLVDGPGVRYVVFLQGCVMRCKYCHNPETWSLTEGKDWTAEDLFKQAYRYKNYWKENGGITVSGGEPLRQIEFLTEFFKLAKQKGVHTTLDTAGQPFTFDEPFFSKFEELMKYTDLVMLDLKAQYDERHKELTGWSNENILAMAKYLSDNGHHMWIRHVLVPDLTDDVEELKEMRKFIDSLNTVDRVEILPYHSLGLFKWEKLGVPYTLKDVRIPTKEEIQQAEDILGVHKQLQFSLPENNGTGGRSC